MSKKNWVMVHITVFQVEWTELWGKEESSIWFWVFSIRYGIDRWQHHFTYIRFGGNKSTELPGRKFPLDTYMYGSCAHEQGREVVFLRLVSLADFYTWNSSRTLSESASLGEGWWRTEVDFEQQLQKRPVLIYGELRSWQSPYKLSHIRTRSWK